MSEVYMHIALGQLLAAERSRGRRCRQTSSRPTSRRRSRRKAEVIDWLKRSLEAVKTAHASVKPEDLQRKVKVNGRDATVDGMYLRIIVHANEHMGQLIAYARMNGIVPPWSKTGGE